MRASPARRPVLILSALIVLFLTGGFFFVDSFLGTPEVEQDAADEEITYLNHDIATSLDYRSDFVGDQGNTFALLGTLPLSDCTSLMSVMDDGVRIQLDDVDLADRYVQRDMAYTASVVVMTISNANTVTYETPQSRVVLSRDEVLDGLEIDNFDGIGVQEWETIRERIPMLADDTIRVTAD